MQAWRAILAVAGAGRGLGLKTPMQEEKNFRTKIIAQDYISHAVMFLFLHHRFCQ